MKDYIIPLIKCKYCGQLVKEYRINHRMEKKYHEDGCIERECVRG